MIPLQENQIFEGSYYPLKRKKKPQSQQTQLAADN